MKITINAERIILKRRDEKIVISEGDYASAYISDLNEVSGGCQYLAIEDLYGTTGYYPLDYWAITIVGKRRGV